FIAVLIIAAAVPSVEGLVAERRLKASFDAFDDLVRNAQARSMTEQRAYLIVWDKKTIFLRPEAPLNPAEAAGVAQLKADDPENFDVQFPAALLQAPPKVWVFWPSGTCEPANVTYSGKAGHWTAKYDPLTVHA